MDVDIVEDNAPMDYEYTRPGPSTRTLPPPPRYLPRHATLAPLAEVTERSETRRDAADGPVVEGVRVIKSLRRSRVAPTTTRVRQIVIF